MPTTHRDISSTRLSADICRRRIARYITGGSIRNRLTASFTALSRGRGRVAILRRCANDACVRFMLTLHLFRDLIVTRRQCFLAVRIYTRMRMYAAELSLVISDVSIASPQTASAKVLHNVRFQTDKRDEITLRLFNYVMRDFVSDIDTGYG